MPVGLPNLASLILLYELQPDLGIYSKPPMTWAGQGQNKSRRYSRTNYQLHQQLGTTNNNNTNTNNIDPSHHHLTTSHHPPSNLSLNQPAHQITNNSRKTTPHSLTSSEDYSTSNSRNSSPTNKSQPNHPQKNYSIIHQQNSSHSPYSSSPLNSSSSPPFTPSHSLLKLDVSQIQIGETLREARKHDQLCHPFPNLISQILIIINSNLIDLSNLEYKRRTNLDLINRQSSQAFQSL
ncbi:hypothetical protein PGT21_029820 [Puccinia graminis f. sp. tritici]|uniref:Uncharacterized protein n=1 Tax=Puccinia graminis f. sp. tritici TaxID=56615 RepID=A0A5B0PA19_PUCGR|nr:hypothetical protein PGT21_029820 [Puccinia graminis f. sp. tritici]